MLRDGEFGLREVECGLSARQRLVLQCLAEEGGVSDPVTLSIECACRIHDRRVERIPLETRRRLFSELTTPVVESLDGRGLVEYDDDRGIVTLRYCQPV